jgi:hypothetical protein
MTASFAGLNGPPVRKLMVSAQEPILAESHRCYLYCHTPSGYIVLEQRLDFKIQRFSNIFCGLSSKIAWPKSRLRSPEATTDHGCTLPLEREPTASLCEISFNAVLAATASGASLEQP